MRAVICDRWGTPADLSYRDDVAQPRVGPGQVLIRACNAAVNFADTLLIAGRYQERPEFPFSPGLEVAGVVEAVGDGVSTTGVGSRVMAAVRWGAFAEQVVAPAQRVIAIPDDMDMADAAAFPVTYGTAHVGLRHRGALRAGETLLVHGAAGGVGLAAVEIGLRLGATVIATAGGVDKCEVLRERGAQFVVDYRSEDLRERVLDVTEGRGADVVFDPVGGDVFDASLRCIAWEGRLLVIGFAAGRIPKAPANYLLLKNCAALGVFWGAYFERDPERLHASFAELLQWYGEGALRPRISARLPLAEAPRALSMLLDRAVTGKIVLDISE